jgi:hypothetical protein
MNTKQKLQELLTFKQENINKEKAILDQLPQLDQLELDATFHYNSNGIDFDFLTHEQTIEVIKVIGGKWTKTPADNGTINYEQEINGIKIRVYHGAPPPNCKIIEVLETIPAQPERVVTVRRLQCQ